MESSILTSIKKLLGIEDAYTQFDTDIIIDINSVFMALTQMGVGPTDGYSITDKNQTWKDFLGEVIKNEGVKTYTFLKVRLMFDPPTSSAVIDAVERQCAELEWRITLQAEGGNTIDTTVGT